MITQHTPRDRGADAVQAFAAALRRRHREAGEPSYHALASMTGISKATISRALRGERLPTWAVVENILRGCRVPRDEVDDRWRPSWVAAADIVRPQRGQRPQAEVAGPNGEPGFACRDCGAWVVDDDRHRHWHAKLLATLGAIAAAGPARTVDDLTQWRGLRSAG